MSLLMEASRIKDETSKEEMPFSPNAENLEADEKIIFLNELEESGKGRKREQKSDENIYETKFTNWKGENQMAGLKDILKEMADEMDGVIALGVIGMDGITVAEHNPTGADMDALSAKFAMIMKLVEKSAKDLKGMGDFEENLVQAKNAWILTRFLNSQYYLAAAVSREGTLGKVRLVAQKYTDQLQRAV